MAGAKRWTRIPKSTTSIARASGEPAPALDRRINATKPVKPTADDQYLNALNERIGSGIFQRLKLKPNILDHFNPDPSKEADIKLAFLHILERHFQAETGMGLHHTLEELRTEMDTHYSSPHFENKFVRPLVDLGLVFLKRGKIAGSWASRLHVDPDILSAHRSE